MEQHEMELLSNSPPSPILSTRSVVTYDTDALSVSNLLPLPDRSSKNTIAEISVADEDVTRVRTTSVSSRRVAFAARLSGWKIGLTIGIAIDVAILLTTVAFTILATSRFSLDGTQATLIENDCSRTRLWTIWLHFVINIFSSALLATSSYAMQCLAAPTRGDVDKAHQRGDVMSIGIPSLRNLAKVEHRRSLLYALAVLSSLPIHLLANSAVFNTIGTHSYMMAVARSDFLDRNASDYETLWPASIYPFNYDHSLGNLTYVGYAQRTMRDLVPNMTRLENAECIRQYSQHLVTGRRHVLAISSNNPPSIVNSSTGERKFLGIAFWYQSINLCSDHCTTGFQEWVDPSLWTCAFMAGEHLESVNECSGPPSTARAANFSIARTPISYCLSEEVEERCLLQADTTVLSVVIVCTLIKIGVLIAARRTVPIESLSTLGDAMASFMSHPDPTTDQSCLLSAADVDLAQKSQRWSNIKKFTTPVHYQRVGRSSSIQSPTLDHWTPDVPFAKRWSTLSLQSTYHHSFSRLHWLGLFAMYFLGLGIGSVFLLLGVQKLKTIRGPTGNTPSSLGALWKFGLGKVNPNFLMPLPDMFSTAASKTMEHALIVNAPQLFLSFSYFFYNSAWTQMLIAREWAAFGKRRQGLRVSRPQSVHQRRSYFLTIPYRFAVPILVSSVLLHWLLSQSIFLARVDVYSGEPFVPHGKTVYNTVGYSLIGLIFLIVLWTFMFIALFAVGLLWRVDSPIPIVGGCSAAISAACHPPIWEQQSGDSALMELKWGVTPDKNAEVRALWDNVGEVKHCSLSAGEVFSPATLPLHELRVKGVLYTTTLFK